MGYITDVVTPAQLTGYVREEVTGGLPFDELFPERQVDDIVYELENVDLTGFNEVARYRTWDTAPPIGRRPGIALIGGEIPPLGFGYRLNEQDLGRLGRVRNGIGERTDQRVVDTIYNDARRAANAVQNRITLTHGQLLSTGSVILSELGNVAANQGIQATFAVPANQLNVVPAVLWSTRATSTPLDNLVDWETIYADNNNDVYPDEWWISRAAALDLRLSAQLRDHMDTVRVPARITDADVAAILDEFGVQGRIRIVDIRRPPLAGGGRQPVLPVRTVIGVRAGMGATLFGIPPIVNVMDGNARIDLREAPGLVAYAFDEIRPSPAAFTFCEGVALPVLTDSNGLFIAQV
ncbi:MAG: major capsid protein [Chloroflexi bacterium]|nr:major capsid protein [Chloroflexota bacterium]